MEKQPTCIDDVLRELDIIIEETKAENNFLGIFAYIYRRTTAGVKEAIEAGMFEDNERMEQFDVAFATYYLNAYRKYKSGDAASRSWLTSFLAERRQLSIVQHLMMGMNAHINLDLALVAADFAPGDRIFDLEYDFKRVNEVLKSLIDEMQIKLGRTSFIVRVIDVVGGRWDEWLIDSGMRQAREKAWEYAVELACLEGEEREKARHKLDQEVETTAQIIRNPNNYFMRLGFSLVRRFETKNVGKIIEKLTRD